MSGSLLLLPERRQDVEWGGKYDLRKGGTGVRHKIQRWNGRKAIELLHGVMTCMESWGKGTTRRVLTGKDS